MTTKQIEILKMLGFEDTQEDGAILQHPKLIDFRTPWSIDGFVWDDAKFDEVITDFTTVFEGSLRKIISREIIEGKVK